jgi:CRP-like cAMP-binding protein
MLHQTGTEQNFYCDTLSADELFSGLTAPGRRSLDSITDQTSIPSGRMAFSSGERPARLYIHRSGSAAVFQSGPTSAGFACPVRPGRIYGLIEALSNNAFTFGVRTITDSDFDVIETDDFLRLIRQDPDLSFKLAEMLSRLYQDAVRRIKSS